MKWARDGERKRKSKGKPEKNENGKKINGTVISKKFKSVSDKASCDVA